MGEQQRQGERKEKDSLHIDWLVVGQSRSLQSCDCHFAVTLRDQWTRREVCTAIKFFAPSRCKESASPSTKQETKILYESHQQNNDSHRLDLPHRGCGDSPANTVFQIHGRA